MGDDAAQRLPRFRTAVVFLVGLAVVLALAGGAVPGIQHQVTYGKLPPEFSPERYLGPPYAGSVSGTLAAEGAILWGLLAICAGIALRYAPRTGVVLLGAAFLLTAFANAALPLLWPNIGWSILGVAQTSVTGSALLLAALARSQARPRQQQTHQHQPTAF